MQKRWWGERTNRAYRSIKKDTLNFKCESYQEGIWRYEDRENVAYSDYREAMAVCTSARNPVLTLETEDAQSSLNLAHRLS